MTDESPETVMVMVDGVTRPATDEELAAIEERQQPAPPVKLASVPPTTFARLLGGVLGLERAAAVLQKPLMFLAYAGATKIDYDDVFIGIDGDPEQPCYAAQLLADEVVTQVEVGALEASWPTT